MDELLRSRVERALDTLPDDKVRQLLDYIEFLQSRYADRSSQPSTLERFADGVEDTLRVGKVPIAALKGTRGVLQTADKVVKGIADAGRVVFDEISDQIKQAAEKPEQQAEPVEGSGESARKVPTDEKPNAPPSGGTATPESDPGPA